MTRIQANLFLLFSGAIWGAGFVAQSTAMDAIGPLWFIGLRFAIATLVALPLALLEKKQAATPCRETPCATSSSSDWRFSAEPSRNNTACSPPPSPIPAS